MDKNVEIYDEEIKVLNRIKELKKNGYDEKDMYIITGEEKNISMLKGMTGVTIKEDDDSIWDRFKSFLSGEDSIVDAFNRMNVSDEDREFYYDQVKDGKILLYVDREYIQYYNLDEDGKFRPIIDPDISSDVDNRENIEEENLETLSREEIPERVKEDLGLEEELEPLGPDEMRRKVRHELLIKEDRDRLK